MNAAENERTRETSAVVGTIRSLVIVVRERVSSALSSAFRAETADEETCTCGVDGRDAGPTCRGNGHATGPLVTPKERILSLVEQNGGKMKQSEIVPAVTWSESTVSRKLGELESTGAISRYRIGREKLVFLPGAEPESLESPLPRSDRDRKIVA